jgi:oligopeptide/dipeptide ABC transporter ATP-binding protein
VSASWKGGALLEVEALARHYKARGQRGPVKAVDGVSFRLYRGETLALVGESGSGKSTTARLVLRLLDVTSGTVRLDGMDITDLSGEPLRRLRRRMQMVFQDPFASLNPRMTVGALLDEPLLVHERGDRMNRRARVNQLLGMVGLSAFHAQRYPHQFSGGQRQRIGIARALAVEPNLLVLDEPVSALDVSIQAQVVNLLQDLQARLQFGALFIAHDLAVVRHVADRVAVMYRGRIVETAPKDELFANPRHPYTRMLLAAIPRPQAHRPEAAVDAENPAEPPECGCAFAPRCAFAQARCWAEAVPDFGFAERGSACHRADELPPYTWPEAAPLPDRLELYAALVRGSGLSDS